MGMYKVTYVYWVPDTESSLLELEGDSARDVARMSAQGAATLASSTVEPYDTMEEAEADPDWNEEISDRYTHG